MDFTPLFQVRRPLIGITLVFLTGLGLEFGFLLNPLLLLGVAALLLAAAGLIRFRKPATFFLLATCGVLAAAHLGMALENTSPQKLAAQLGRERGAITLAGTVMDEPFTAESGGRSQLRLDAVKVKGDWVSSQGKLRLYLPPGLEEMKYGQRWRLSGYFSLYPEVRSGGVIGYLSLKRPQQARLLKKASRFSLRGWCFAGRQRAARILQSGVEAFPVHVQLLHALLLGYRQALPPELYRQFARSGLLHIFAISGLHVGIVAIMLVAALKVFGITRNRWGFLLIPALFIYVLSTGLRPSAFRAFVMTAVYFSAPLFRRKPDSPLALAFAALLLLVLNPVQVREAGFLLSFTVVTGLVLVHRRAADFFPGLYPAVPGGETRLACAVRSIRRYIGLLALTSLAAWIFSAPLAGYFFNMVSPLAPLGNMLVIPAAFLVVMTGGLSLLSGTFLLPLAEIFNHANRLFIEFLFGFVGRMGQLPGAYRFFSSPPLYVLALWYAGWIAMLSASSRRIRGLAALCITLAAAGWLQNAVPAPNRISISRPAGDETFLVRTPDRTTVLVNTGPPYLEFRLLRNLKAAGLNRIDRILLTETGSAVALSTVEGGFAVGTVEHTDQTVTLWRGTAGEIELRLD